MGRSIYFLEFDFLIYLNHMQVDINSNSDASEKHFFLYLTGQSELSFIRSNSKKINFSFQTNRREISSINSNYNSNSN